MAKSFEKWCAVGSAEESATRTADFVQIGNDIAILLESFNKNSIDGAVTALLAELACGGL